MIARRLGDSWDDPQSLSTSSLGRLPFHHTVAELLRSEQARHARKIACWLLKPKTGPRSLRYLLVGPPAIYSMTAIVLCHMAQYFLLIASWALLGSILFYPVPDSPRMALWVMSIATMLLFRLAASWLSSCFALRVGLSVKDWMLERCLSASARDVQSEGIGRMLATSIDANRIDTFAVNGTIRVLLGVLEIAVLLGILFVFGMHELLFLMVVLVSVVLLQGVRFYRSRQSLHDANINVTGIHTEEMIGHRARKSLVSVEGWYEREDSAFANYAAQSQSSDHRYQGLEIAPRVWLVLGIVVGVLVAYFDQSERGIVVMSSLGIVILGFITFQNIVMAMVQLTEALICYSRVNGTFRMHTEPSREAEVEDERHGGGLSVVGLTYKYPDSSFPILKHFNMTLAANQHRLIEGESGSGKSTLAKIIAGRLLAEEGTVLFGGRDVWSVDSSRWRERVCYVPQSHVNHVLTAPFAFNLLMGREWPPQPESMEAARKVIQSVGLDALVARMPGGMMQVVGEGGWTLSQGERARLFVARALLQRADLLIVDEPLDALDPIASVQVLNAIGDHAGTALLIAHK
jgi:ATP-binding cassette subfamily B protein